MKLLEKIKHSIYSPSFYAKIPHNSLGSSLKYFFLLILIISLVSLISSFYTLFVTFPQELKNMVTESTNYYPEDLILDIKDGQVSTTATQPYFIPLPESDTQTTSSDSTYNLVVIDTQTPYSSDQFNQYKTIAWLTKDTLFVQGEEDRVDIRAIKLTEVKDLTIDRSFVKQIADKILPWLNIVGPLLVLAVFLGLFLALTFTLAYLLILNLLILLLSKLFKWTLTYSQSYKIAVHASTLGLIINLLVTLTSPFTGFNGFPFMFTLITLSIVILNLTKSKSSS